MKKTRLTRLSCALLLACTLSSHAAPTSPLWMRYPCISPDGKQIAFSYQGDLYSVPVEGGDATRLTGHSAYDTGPVWSPDGKQIAFVSDRHHGGLDIYIMSSGGGAARQLTTHSAAEKLHGFTPDGRYVLFSAHYQDPVKSILFPTPRMTEIYQIPVEGGPAEPLLAIPAGKVVCTPDGKGLVYQDLKGFENTWRKHHTSSVTRDILLYNFETQKHTPLVTWKGEDLDPVLSPDGRTLYYLSERSGSLNIYSQSISQGEASAKALTTFAQHPVRFLSASLTGTLCFGFDGEIYTLVPGATPRKVNIHLTNDNDPQECTPMTFTSGIRSAAVSPDGKELAFQIRGEIFVTSSDYPTTKRITETTAAEKSVCFGSDGRTLIYDSERTGRSDIYVARIVRKEDPNFTHATLIAESPLIPSNKEEKSSPQLSPDGKKVAFTMARRYLMLYDMETKKLSRVMEDKLATNGQISCTWSPDSRWLAIEYVDNHHAPFSDIGLVDATAANPTVHNITQTGYFDTNPRFVLGGNAVLFSSDRFGMKNLASWGSQQDLMLIFLNRESYDKFRLSAEDYELWKEGQKRLEKETKAAEGKGKKPSATPTTAPKPVDVEWDHLDRRTVRLTTASGKMGDAYITPDGDKLYYLCAVEGGYDLWSMDLRKRTPSPVKKLNGSGGTTFLPDSAGKTVFMVSGKEVQKLILPAETLKPVTFRAEMKLNAAEERAYMYDVVRREEAARFYSKDMHGVDWQALTRHYEKFLPHVTNNYDFSEMLSELLGELNVSHTGSGFRPPKNAPQTAEPGVFVHRERHRDGLVIDEVVVGGPLDTHLSQVEVGDIIEQIDGTAITSGTDYYPLLSGKADKPTLLTLYSPRTGKRWQEVIKPLTPSRWQELLYRRWIEQRAQEVERLSDGKLGYAHIPSMDDDSFRGLYSDALGKYYQRDGMVVDIRYNGGGRLHEDLEVFLSGTKYLTQEVRGAYYCDMPSRRWTKPSVMVMCEADYSNAHGSPWVYKKMKLGKLVGMPVPGTMTSVNWVTLQDPSLYFGIPVVGYRTDEGYYLENHGLEPDIRVPLDLTKALQGHDTQLEAAVRQLMSESRKD